MNRFSALVAVLSFAASLFVQIVAVSHADAGSACTYTSSDRKKGYKC